MLDWDMPSRKIFGNKAMALRMRSRAEFLSAHGGELPTRSSLRGLEKLAERGFECSTFVLKLIGMRGPARSWTAFCRSFGGRLELSRGSPRGRCRRWGTSVKGRYRR